ncbi:ERF family protein [Klebsiella aerogenes]|uniref:ERF family protein n=1 Tax=Klebsiella aerogenes TaxID=548 RepID=UPI001C23697B|nr:ERF family protein [Klebsiella aerogenes]QXA73920.1 ERF family protein [Klebsiella aerogenes]
MTRTEFTAQVATIQANLNAPKGQYNSFGGYHYRSAEDILNAVKPLLGGLFLSISDDIIQLGDRFYVKATATITDGEHAHTVSAMAREPITKKGMDESQITGATSSYARKYALNGLFGIDDAKDADTDAHAHQTGQQPRNNRQQQGGQRQQQQRPQNQQRGQQQQGGQRNHQNGGQRQQGNQQQRPPATPNQIVAALKTQLAKVSTRQEVDNLYSRAWKALDGNGEAQSLAHSVRNSRLAAIKQAQQAA